jgi:hypothetical protein
MLRAANIWAALDEAVEHFIAALAYYKDQLQIPETVKD